MIRSLMAISVVVLAGMPLAGCRPRPPTAARAGTATDGTVELTLWHIMNYAGPREVIAEAVSRFEAAHPGTTVRVETFDNDPYKTKLAIEMASGTPPDVFFTWGGGGLAALVEAGRVVDLTAALEREGWRARFLDAAMSLCTVADRAYAVPLDLSAVLLWYNREFFAARDLAAPRTTAELLALCARFREDGITPLALGNMQEWPGAFYFIYLAARAGGVPLFLDAAAGTPGAHFDDPSFVEAGRLVQELVRARAFPVGFNGVDDAQARTQFLNGRAAMYLMGTWFVARILAENPEFMDKAGCAPFPALDGVRGDPATVVGGVNCAFAVSKASRHPEKAIELLRFLTAAPVAEAWCEIGRIPALRVDETALERLPAPTRAAFDRLMAAPALQPYYDQYLAPRLAEEHKKTTQELFGGSLTPEAAATRMRRTAEALR